MPKKPSYEELEQRVNESQKESIEHTALRSGKKVDNRTPRRLFKDLFPIVLIGVIGTLMMALLDAYEVIYKHSRLLEMFNLDEIILFLPLFFAIGLTWVLHQQMQRLKGKIIQSKRVEEALKESEEKYRDIFENGSDLLYFHNLEGNFTKTNLAWKKEYSFTEDDLANLDVRELIPERYKHQFDDYLKKVKENGKDEGLMSIMTKDGRERILEYNNSLVHDSIGPIGVQGSARDITERIHTERALRQSEEKYRTILESIEDGYYEVDITGNLTFFNDSLCKMTGYTKDELMGMNNRQYTDKDTAKRLYQIFNKIYATGKPIKGFEYEIILNRYGTKKHVESSISLIRDRKGQPIGFRGILRDITQRKLAEEEKEKLQAQLAQAQKVEAIGTLAGGIAHNFNNLLMGIQGNASLMLLEIDSNHPNYERVKNIEKSVQNGSRLTHQLLGYAREGGYEIKTSSLNQLIKETSETFAMSKKEIGLHLKLGKDLFGIKADQGQIEQVLLNLYVNAADAMSGGGDLFLKTTNVTHKDMRGKPYEAKPGNYVLLTVRDTGTGMDRKTQEKIFEPFFTTKGLAKGTGLGLASVYGIIKAHGGYIDVESEKGKGTTFTIYLPASSEKEVIKEKQLPEKILKGKETILLVDDEDIVLDVGEEMLKALGYKVLLAKSGKEAIEIVSKAHRAKSKEQEGKERYAPSAMPPAPDMVLLDMIMPEMGGGKTYDKMKEINPDIKVLLSSGYSIDGQATEILKRGCDGFIQKPFDMQGLSQRIRKILDKQFAG
jgi:PAS domain S-box-containing protein